MFAKASNFEGLIIMQMSAAVFTGPFSDSDGDEITSSDWLLRGLTDVRFNTNFLCSSTGSGPGCGVVSVVKLPLYHRPKSG